MFKYQEGGMIPQMMNPQGMTQGADDSRMQIYQALMSKGMLGDMSYEEFQQIPPQQLRQMLQGVQQMMCGGRSKYQMGDRTGMGDVDTMSMGNDMGPMEGMNDNSNNPSTMGSVKTKKPVNQGAINAGMQAGLGAVGTGFASMGDDKSSAGTTKNVASTMGSNIANYASMGSVAGPWGALAGAGVGAVMGGIDVAQANEKEQKQMQEAQKADNVGTLGTSLNPLVAAYGARVAEQGVINRMRNRVDNYQNHIGEGRYSQMSRPGGVGYAGQNQVPRYFNDNAQNGRRIFDRYVNQPLPEGWEEVGQVPKSNPLHAIEYKNRPRHSSMSIQEWQDTQAAKNAELQMRNENIAKQNQVVQNRYNQDLEDLNSMKNMYYDFQNTQSIPMSEGQMQQMQNLDDLNYFRRTAGMKNHPLGQGYVPTMRNGGATKYGMGGGYYGKKC